MNTEPVGFKGTNGIWRAEPIFSASRHIGNRIVTNEVVIMGLPLSKYHNQPTEEQNADMCIAAASKKMAIALQKIEKHINDSGLKMIDLENPLQAALYHIKHLSKEALKEAGL